jgi:hypothetical protein
MYQFLQTVFLIYYFFFLFKFLCNLSFSNIHHIIYIIFFQTFSLVCFSQVLHFIRVEHRVGISRGLRWTSLYSMMFLNPCWHAHLHLMHTCKILRMTMTVMETLSSMNFVCKLINNFIVSVYINFSS